MKNRFITSAALKKRGEGSQIEMNRANGEAPLSTYQAQTRGASGLAERAKATRPGTSEFWKVFCDIKIKLMCEPIFLSV